MTSQIRQVEETRRDELSARRMESIGHLLYLMNPLRVSEGRCPCPEVLPEAGTPWITTEFVGHQQRPGSFKRTEEWMLKESDTENQIKALRCNFNAQDTKTDL